MQQIINQKRNWQSKPEEKMVPSIPKIKLESTIPKEKIPKPLSLEQTLLERFLKNIPYPDFRYFCPTCGSLDVCITIHKQTQKMIVDCLDCKKEWVSKYLHEERTATCLC